MKKLAGKIALVTGSSKGIGAAVAKHLASEGAKVFVNYSQIANDASKVVAEIVEAGGEACSIQGDVSKSDDVGKIFTEIKKQNGHLDILVNNAGIFDFKPFAEINSQDFHKHFDLNFLGLIQVTQEAVLLMRDGGSIVNVSSIASKKPGLGNIVYVASKAAMDSITVLLSLLLGERQIRVNSVNPGMVKTEGYRTSGLAGSSFEKDSVALTPMGRIATTDEIAKVVLFLASGDSGWVSGKCKVVAGGRRQRRSFSVRKTRDEMVCVLGSSVRVVSYVGA